MARPTDGSIPVLTARGKSLAEAWESSLLELSKHGAEVRTEYDAKDEAGGYVDPPSLDCTMLMVCEEPAAEPLIHRAFPGGLEDLEEYRQEVSKKGLGTFGDILRAKLGLDSESSQ